MKVIIAGGRDFDDYSLMKRKLDHLFSKRKPDEIVTGLCPTGADALAEHYAFENRIDFIGIPANWDEHKKAAGPIRNRVMAEYCDGPKDACVCFWDGVSRGTKNMIETSKKKGLDVRVIYY